MKTVLSIRMLLVLFIMCDGCRSQPLPNSRESDIGTFRYSVHDTSVIEDLIKTCDKRLHLIASDLQVQFRSDVTIEIYPNQDEYDKFIMNPEFRGSPAISGNNRIQLVSPLSKIKIDTISYSSRLLFLLHEYVHILIDQIDNSLPVFLDEGLACYYGSYDFYKAVVTKHANELTFFPTLDQLQDHYNEIPAADVYSFLFIDYLMNTNDCAPISHIIRNQNLLGPYKDKWIQYVKDTYQ